MDTDFKGGVSMEKKVLIKKAVHITPKCLVKGEYRDKSKHNYYGGGCSHIAKAVPKKPGQYF